MLGIGVSKEKSAIVKNCGPIMHLDRYTTQIDNSGPATCFSLNLFEAKLRCFQDEGLS